MWSPASADVATLFDVSTEVTTLGLALYVLGFATGPIIWAPLSELKGRKPPLIIGAFGLGVFLIGCAVAKDLQTLLLCRFFAGVFGAAPLTCGAAVVSEISNNSERGIAVAVYSLAGFGGPFLAPTMGGFIVDSYLGWRWTQYLPAILAFSALALNVFVLEESYPAVILVRKAERLRKISKNWGIHAKQEEIQVNFSEIVHRNLSRPLRLLFTEPIVFLLSVYTAFIYGVLYVFLTAYPIAFQQIRGWNSGVGALPMLAMIIGELLACAYLMLGQKNYVAELRENDDVNIPEWRLPPMVVGGVLYSIGLFWFGWTGYRSDIHWIGTFNQNTFSSLEC
jgi:MFS transporter, DHA1 family, multidrug resistance protein